MSNAYSPLLQVFSFDEAQSAFASAWQIDASKNLSLGRVRTVIQNQATVKKLKSLTVDELTDVALDLPMREFDAFLEALPECHQNTVNGWIAVYQQKLQMLRAEEGLAPVACLPKAPDYEIALSTLPRRDLLNAFMGLDDHYVVRSLRELERAYCTGRARTRTA